MSGTIVRLHTCAWEDGWGTSISHRILGIIYLREYVSPTQVQFWRLLKKPFHDDVITHKDKEELAAGK